MASETFAARLQKEIDLLRGRLMSRPLNQAIFNGTLPVPVLREYAKQAPVAPSLCGCHPALSAFADCCTG